jgi:RecB family exonuclease
VNLDILLETELEPIKRLSPSRFIELKTCALRGILSASNFSSLLPLSPNARLGSIIHKMYELASKKAIRSEADFSKEWDKALNQEEAKMISGLLEKNLVPLERHAKDFEVKKNMCLRGIKPLFQTQPVTQDKEDHFQSVRSSMPATGSEYWIETEDKKLGGIVDEIRQTGDGIEIIDYKSGELFETTPDGARQIKKAYEIQLKMYAGLYFLKFKKCPVKLRLLNLNQASVDVPFTLEECLSLVEEAKQKLKETGDLISHNKDWENLANPHPQTCRYCAFRPVCKKYINTEKHESDWPFDVIGKVKEKRLFQQNGYRVVVETNTGKFNVRGLDEQRHSIFNDEVENVMIFNLKKDSSPGNFIANDFTVSYATPHIFL